MKLPVTRWQNSTRILSIYITGDRHHFHLLGERVNSRMQSTVRCRDQSIGTVVDTISKLDVTELSCFTYGKRGSRVVFADRWRRQEGMGERRVHVYVTTCEVGTRRTRRIETLLSYFTCIWDFHRLPGIFWCNNFVFEWTERALYSNKLNISRRLW